MSLFELICEIEASLNFLINIYYDILFYYFSGDNSNYYCNNIPHLSLSI